MDLMIDLETYALGPKPAIVQIGAVLFSPYIDMEDATDERAHLVLYRRD